MVMSLGQGMVVPTIPVLAATFDVTAGMAAQLVTAGMLGRVISLLPTGQIVDRYGRKPVLVGAPLLVALGSALTAMAPFFGLVLVAQFFAGMGLSSWLIAREVALVDVVRPEQRGPHPVRTDDDHPRPRRCGLGCRSYRFGELCLGLQNLTSSSRSRSQERHREHGLFAEKPTPHGAFSRKKESALEEV
jgi:hypothetical protein